MGLAGIGTLKAGADVHCKTNDGYVSALQCRPWRVSMLRTACRESSMQSVRAVCVHVLCSFTALHAVSVNGLTETAKALISAGADVHCKERTKGYALG
jgi:hypothetical protein